MDNKNYPRQSESGLESKNGSGSAQQDQSVMDLLWLRMSEMYGSQWVTTYGPSPTDSWARVLSGFTTDDIRRGLEAVVENGAPFPPNAPEFRKLCMKPSISPTGINANAYLEYSSTLSRVSSKETASAYMSVMRHCLGSDMALPAGYAGSEPMEVTQAAAYVRSHMARTKRQYIDRFTPEYNRFLDKHYLGCLKETEQMMQEHGL